MKTYLPYPDVNKSAEVLDDRRLNRQRSDVVAILKKLDEAPASEEDHPAVKMWRGNELFLIKYGMAVCIEYQSRGNQGMTLEKIMEFQDQFDSSSSEPPEWWGNEKFHTSHKSYLLRSLPSHYRNFWPSITDELPLIWPRSPEKARKGQERREQEKLIKKAIKAREKAEKYLAEAREAANNAGLDPDTMEPLPDDEVELVTLGTPDEELLDL